MYRLDASNKHRTRHVVKHPPLLSRIPRVLRQRNADLRRNSDEVNALLPIKTSLPPSLPPSLLPSFPPSLPPSLLPSLPPSLPLCFIIILPSDRFPAHSLACACALAISPARARVFSYLLVHSRALSPPSLTCFLARSLSNRRTSTQSSATSPDT